MLAVVIFSAVSLQQLSGLQGPLASLNAAAHTLYRTGRVRTLLSLFAFEENRDMVEVYRHSLQAEVDLLRKEYSILLYGGKIDRVVRQSKWAVIRVHAVPLVSVFAAFVNSCG